MSTQPVSSESGAPASFLAGKLQYIHIAMEFLVIGIVYYVMNRKVTSLQGDLVECAVRIAAQNKKIAELESKMDEMSEVIEAVSRRSMQPMMMPPMQPMMPRQMPVFQSFPATQTGSSITVGTAPVISQSAPAVASDASASEQPSADERTAAVSVDELDTQLAAELQELGTAN